MATQRISMNIIKQVLIRLSQRESIRPIAAALHMNMNTVSRYKALEDADPMALRDLLMLEDTILNHRFNGGNPAHCNHRIEAFNEMLPYLEAEIKKRHVTVRQLWEESRQKLPRLLS